MKTLCAVFAAVFAGVLCAQTSVNVTGNVGDTEEDFYLYNVDFGGASQTIDLTLTIAATSGTSGLAADLVDLEEMCLNGSATGVLSDFDAATGTITIMMSATYTGVVQFALSIATDSENGPSPYTGTLAASAGTIAAAGSQTFTIVFETQQTLLGRAQRFLTNPLAGGVITRDFTVNFGAAAHAVTFYAQSVVFGNATFSFYEISAAGAELLLGTLTDDDEANLTTGSRSGSVRIRVRINATNANPKIWTCVFPGTVTVTGAASSGGGGKDKDGCVAGSGSAALPAALAFLFAAVRRRRMNH